MIAWYWAPILIGAVGVALMLGLLAGFKLGVRAERMIRQRLAEFDD